MTNDLPHRRFLFGKLYVCISRCPASPPLKLNVFQHERFHRVAGKAAPENALRDYEKRLTTESAFMNGEDGNVVQSQQVMSCNAVVSDEVESPIGANPIPFGPPIASEVDSAARHANHDGLNADQCFR
jgi:hypothetical protein